MATKIDLSRYIVGEIPDNLVRSPSLLEGSFGADIYAVYQKTIDTTYQRNPNLTLRLEKSVVVNPTFFDNVLINQLMRSGNVQGTPRILLLKDLSDPRVLAMVKDKYYANAQALVLRSITDSTWPINEPLTRFLAEQQGVELLKLEREPALMYGFDLQLDSTRGGYDLLAVPNDRFTVVHDDRFLAKYDGYWFTKVDELGIPVDLNEGKQSKNARKWFTREGGLSKVCIASGLALYSDMEGLGDSDHTGRVVILSDEATAPKK